MQGKSLWTSKTFWTNILIAAWAFIGPLVGVPTLDPSMTAGILVIVNLILRAVTKSPIVWEEKVPSFLLPWITGAAIVLGAGQSPAQTTSRHWLFEPDLATGALKIVQNEAKDGITANIFPAAGIGAAYRYVEWNADTKEWDAVFGVALDIFVGGEIGGQFNLSPTLKAEFFDGWLQIGGGYDAGYVGDRSRWFGLFSSNFGFM
jgi:hypothetical protein